jgi:hypothetical protein
VEPNFDSRAMNEIGFQKNGALSLSWEEFEQKYRRVEGHELTSRAEGFVQNEAEDQVLRDLLEQLKRVEAGLANGSVVLIESEPGKDYPRTREKQKTVVVGMDNRLHFERTVDPPLRVAVYAERGV